MYGLGLASMLEGIALGGDTFDDATTFDYCGDTIRIVGGLADGTVECMYWNDALVQQYARFADWMQKGYCWPDSVYSSPEGGGAGLMKQNMAFSEIITSEVGVEATKKASIGYDYLVKPIKNIPIGSDQVAKFGLSVNSTCEEPAAAMKFINAMYTDSYVMQLLVQGIEGEHYVLDEEGIADFPTPGDSNSSSYHCAEFLFGNQFLLHPWSGNSADFRETSFESFKSAPNSIYLGFAFDTSALQNDVAAISAVNERYLQSLTGGGYTEQIMEDLRSELKAAGIDTYVEAMREQIDAWKKNK